MNHRNVKTEKQKENREGKKKKKKKKREIGIIAPSARGVWLKTDRGELDKGGKKKKKKKKIIERNAQVASKNPLVDTGFGNKGDFRPRKDEKRYHDDDDDLLQAEETRGTPGGYI